MDNFMDRLTKRFNAGELIQANGEAEARENERLRKQTAEYEKMMQEIRRLNLKTVEVSEQVSQMLSCGIEQLEEYEAKLRAYAVEDEAKETEAAVDAQQMNLTITQELAEQKKALDQQIVGMQELMDAQLKNMQDSMGVQFSGVDDKLSGVGDRLSAVDEKLEHLSGNIADNAIRQHSLLQDMAVNTENALQDLTRTTEDAIQNLQSKLEQQKPADNTELIEAAGQIKEMIVNIRLYLDDVQKHIEDYVHKEDVKVYRNVQAVLMEQLSNKTRDLNDHMDSLEKSVQKSKGTKPLLVFAILLSAASLTIQILQMLGIL